MKNEDKRVKRTKKALRSALLELLLEKDFHEISITELVKKTEMSRSTFYDNYDDLAALRLDMENNAIDKLVLISKITPTVKSKTFYRALLKFLAENPQLSHLFFSGNVSKQAINRVGELFSASYIKALRKQYEINATDDELKHHALFCFSGINAIVEKWHLGEIVCSIEELILLLGNMESDWSMAIERRLSLSQE